jgi:hypothetical protein
MTGGTDVTLITADTVSGEFEGVTAEGYTITLTYNNDAIIAHVERVN